MRGRHGSVSDLMITACKRGYFARLVPNVVSPLILTFPVSGLRCSRQHFSVTSMLTLIRKVVKVTAPTVSNVIIADTCRLKFCGAIRRNSRTAAKRLLVSLSSYYRRWAYFNEVARRLCFLPHSSPVRLFRHGYNGTLTPPATGFTKTSNASGPFAIDKPYHSQESGQLVVFFQLFRRDMLTDEYAPLPFIFTDRL